MVQAQGKMSEQAIGKLESSARRKVQTSMTLTSEEIEILKRVAKELGISRSKAAGLAMRRYAVEMGVVSGE